MIEKKVVTSLNKCYSLAEVIRNGEPQYLVASEKEYACLLLSRQGEVLDTVWEGPGGVMTMEPLKGANGAFLATHRFYSPNNSAEASIVLAQPKEEGWEVSTLCDLPFVHRFGILERDGHSYIAAATLKSAHAFKDDWTCPGRVWVGELSGDLSTYSSENPLPLTPLISGLYKNHGFFKFQEDGHDAALIGAENGIYKIVPPAAGGQWSYELLLNTPASDMMLADFDGDGEAELLVLSPFHGSELNIYKKKDGQYRKVFTAPYQMPFLHAIAKGVLAGREVAVIGYRQGERDLILISWCNGGYDIQVLDHDIGPTNVLCRSDGDKLWILAANREINEVTIYLVSGESER